MFAGCVLPITISSVSLVAVWDASSLGIMFRELLSNSAEEAKETAPQSTGGMAPRDLLSSLAKEADQISQTSTLSSISNGPSTLSSGARGKAKETAKQNTGGKARRGLLPSLPREVLNTLEDQTSHASTPSSISDQSFSPSGAGGKAKKTAQHSTGGKAPRIQRSSLARDYSNVPEHQSNKASATKRRTE